MNSLTRSTFVLLFFVASALLFSRGDELLGRMYRSPKNDSTLSAASRKVSPIRFVNVRAVIEEGQLRLKWSTIDPDGKLLPTCGEARYGTEGVLGTSTGESKAKRERHIKRIEPYQVGATYTYQIFARTEATPTVASVAFTYRPDRRLVPRDRDGRYGPIGYQSTGHRDRPCVGRWGSG